MFSYQPPTEKIIMVYINAYRGFTEFLRNMKIGDVFELPENKHNTSLYQSAIQAGIKVRSKKDKITGKIIVQRVK